jgi:hypothetical protein
MGYTAITYIGKSPDFVAKVKKDEYSFEWQNSIGVGKGRDEVPENIAIRLSKWRDKKGRCLFTLE